MRVLVTGASGFVGRAAVSALVAQGATVIGLARKRLPELAIEWIEADLLEEGAAAAILRKAAPDVVLHLAWATEHGRFWSDPANDLWLARSVDLAKAARDCGVSRLVMTGTCYEYAFPAEGDCIEGRTPVEAHFPYDIAKAACHRACAQLLADSDVTFSWARLFYLYGPHEHQARLAPSVAHALLRGEAAACSSGLAVRDYMHVADVGAGLAALALSKVEGAVNVASGEGTSITHLAQIIAQLVGRPDLLKLRALPDRADEPPRITADVSRLAQEVGFRPRFDLRSGLADALAFWRAQG